MHVVLLEEIIVIFGLSMLVLVLCHRMHIPPIVGFLLTGILAGPHGFGLAESVAGIEVLAEIGVILLLFTIGAEFSLAKLLEIRRLVLVGGLLQVGLTFGVTFGLAHLFGLEMGTSVLLGFVVSMSSTALVLKILQERGEVDSLSGKTSLGILLFQDLAIVPFMLLVPMLGNNVSGAETSLLPVILKGTAVVVVSLLASRWLVPKILDSVVSTENRELFLLTIVFLCFAVAFLTQKVGLSPALGAFLAGLVVSESEYAQQALGNIIPFQQLFTTFFFVSVGMLLDTAFAMEHLGTILLLTGGIIFLKMLLAIPSALALGFSLRIAVVSALGIAQIGEFSFILLRSGLAEGVIEQSLYQHFLTVSILTLALTPFLTTYAPRAAEGILRLPWPKRLRSGWQDTSLPSQEQHVSNHLLIVGFGVNGKASARAAELAGIQYRALDVNPERVREARAQNLLVRYGDATEEAVLLHEDVKQAKMASIAISDPVATRRIVSLAKQLNPSIHIVVRTRLVSEIEELHSLGADEVIPDELEASVEVSSRILSKFLVPRSEIEKFISNVRADNYERMRTHTGTVPRLSDLKLHVPQADIMTFRVDPSSSHVGRTLAEIMFRNEYGVTLLAVKRADQVLPNPGSTTTIHAGDIVLLLGPAKDYAELELSFHGPRTEPETAPA